MAENGGPASIPSLRDLIRVARLRKGWRQADLAKAMGGIIDQTSISRTERGETVSPDPRVLKAMAEVLELDPVEVLIAAKWANSEAQARKVLAAASTPLPQPADVQGANRRTLVSWVLGATDEQVDWLLTLLNPPKIRHRPTRRATAPTPEADEQAIGE